MEDDIAISISFKNSLVGLFVLLVIVSSLTGIATGYGEKSEHLVIDEWSISKTVTLDKSSASYFNDQGYTREDETIVDRSDWEIIQISWEDTAKIEYELEFSSQAPMDVTVFPNIKEFNHASKSATYCPVMHASVYDAQTFSGEFTITREEAKSDNDDCSGLAGYDENLRTLSIAIQNYNDQEVELEYSISVTRHGLDSDDDGLADKNEREKYSTDPTDSDTDGDGLNDGEEIQQGTDPTDSDSPSDETPTKQTDDVRGTETGDQDDVRGPETVDQESEPKTVGAQSESNNGQTNDVQRGFLPGQPLNFQGSEWITPIGFILSVMGIMLELFRGG